jgi:nitroreductase/Pyruvate/2-oxoacid:ferredoxin oxidoreductase delta subunit
MRNFQKQLTQREAAPVVDGERCNGCGLCRMVCPKETLAIEDGKAVIRNTLCLACDHCAAACPADAIRVPALDPSLSRFASFPADCRWLPHGRFDTTALLNLMGSRRSCRNFLDGPVDRAIIEDLIKAGITAPSGSNCQPWAFTILPDREAVARLARRVGDFFKGINRRAGKRWLRTALRLIGKPELEAYYRLHYPAVEKALQEWVRSGRDRLFHGAPAAIVVSADNDASCPGEDALLATGNILLAAHAMGLGTCLIGFVIEAMRRDRRIVRLLGIPRNETPHAVIALGWPCETYQRTAGRKPALIRYTDSMKCLFGMRTKWRLPSNDKNGIV